MGKTVLLVEDNPDDVELAELAFAQTGLSVELAVAHDGQQAIDYLCHRPPPALVLLDLNLPKLSGHEVLAFIRRTPAIASLPVVVLSTSTELDDLRSARRLNVDGYVQKPVAFVEFVDAVGNIAREWLVAGSPAG